MDGERDDIVSDETEQETPVRHGHARPSSRPWRQGALAIAFMLLVLAAAVLTDVVTASPRLCSSCHEIQVRARSWERSPHAGVQCVSCHQAPRAWYDLPGRLVDRVRLLGGDIVKHTAGRYRDPIDYRIAGAAPMPDAVCLQCHTVDRKATSGFRIIIDHPAHAKRNGSCVSCHIRTAHPIANRSVALSLMTTCFNCHGTAKTAKAPGRCSLCHPSGYVLRPASHKKAPWPAPHGKLAIADLKQCEMCHTKSTCDGCHGIEMPHPMGWAQTAHGVAAKVRGRGTCTPCHQGAPDMCTMCHHESYKPGEGPWVQQHAKDAERRGIPYCLKCHSQLECVRCHEKQGVSQQP